MEKLATLKSASAGRKPLTLNLVWVDGGRDSVDLTGIVHRSRHFEVYAGNQAAFRSVSVTEFGGGVEWTNGLDYSATGLKLLADEQRPMSGRELSAFEAENGLNTAETSALLGIAERTVRAYRHEKALPATVAITLRAMRANKALLAAHYRPIPRPMGRPRKSA